MVDEQTTEIVSRATAIYDRELRSRLESTHFGNFVTIEPDSSDHFVGISVRDAASQCLRVHPDRRSFTIRIGYPAAYEIGYAAS